jgi:hypothetical protein
VDPATGSFGIRPRDLNPYWVDVPMLYALSRWGSGLIGMMGTTGKKSSAK